MSTVVAWRTVRNDLERLQPKRRSLEARRLLAHLLRSLHGADAAGITLVSTGRFTKPTLFPRLYGSEHELDVSIAHAGDMVACAVSEHGACGVDCEPLRTGTSRSRGEFDLLAPGERRWLERQSDDAQFDRLWTVKEAFLKATGEGLSRDLQGFEATIEPPGIIDGSDDGRERRILCERWDVADHSVAVVAITRDASGTGCRQPFRLVEFRDLDA